MSQLLATILATVTVVGAFEYNYQSRPGIVHYPVPSSYIVKEEYNYFPKPYSFKYGVNDPHSGDIKSQHEVRHGEVVKGEYSVKEADGTVRIVKYTADPHHGFQAKVYRIGHSVHPKLYKRQYVVPAVGHYGHATSYISKLGKGFSYGGYYKH